jgi:nucleoid-associated protein YgaU
VSPASGTNELSHAGLSANIEGGMVAPQDTAANAHQFLLKDSGMMGLQHITPGLESAALAAPPIPGAESAIAGAMPGVIPGAEQISPMIQLIMRMPGHLGIMNSFFEFLSTMFMPAGDLVAGIDLSMLAGHAQSAMASLASSAGEHVAINPSLLPADAPIFKTIGSSQISSSIGEHASTYSRAGLNVSGNLDLSKAQFEGAAGAAKSAVTGRSDLISGPHMTADASTANHLSGGTRIFGGDKLSTPTFNSLSASSNIPTAGTVPNAMSGMNVGASTFTPDVGKLPAVGNISDGAISGPGLSNSVGSHLGSIGRGSIDGSAVGPSGAVSSQLGGKNLLAMDSYQPTMGADRIVPDAPSNSLLPKDTGAAMQGLKAKQLSLEGIKGAHAPKPSLSHSVKTPQHHLPTKSGASHGIDHSKLTSHQPELSKASQFQKPAIKHPDAAKVEAAHARAAEVPAQTTDTTATTTDGTQIGDAGATDATTNYTVQPGDNLWDIAKSKLGDGFKWQEIYNLNKDLVGVNPDLIQPGTTLHLPTDQAVAAATTDATKYIVQPGDNLWQIAQDHLGSGDKWGEIFQANSQTIGSNPSLIYPGTELSLPGVGTQVANAAPAAIDPSVAMQQAPMQPTTAAMPDATAQAMPDASTQAMPSVDPAQQSYAQGYPAAQPVMPASGVDPAIPAAGAAQAAPVLPQVTPNNSLVSSSLKPDLSFLNKKLR